MSRIFLTGGTGMLGAHLLLDLARSGTSVRALKRRNSDLRWVRKIFSWYASDADRLFDAIEWVDGDLMEKESLREAMAGVDVVIHAAAKVSFDPGDREVVLRENMEGTAYLVDLALELKIPRFCHVSSVAALGNPDAGITVKEDFSWKNDRKRSAYSESKFQSEVEVWRGIEEGLQAIIVNPSVILGPGNWHNSSPRLFQTVYNGMKFYTSGGTGFVDVRDVSKVILQLLQPEAWESAVNQRFVLSAENLTYRDLFGQIASALQRPQPTIPANRLLLQLGWRGSRLVSALTGKQPSLTRETARSASRTSLYDGSKITRTIDFAYTPISRTIQEIGKIFLKDIVS